MSLALKQAQKVLGNTNINPAVGCVLTKKNKLISAGHTSYGGRPHAEANAIDLIKNDTRDSEIYVTLEPCSNYGVTSPCVNKIIKSKIKKVFYSLNDPDLKSYKKSLMKFKRNKISTNVGLLKFKCTKFYKSYLLSKKKSLPYVRVKFAVSKDYFSINKKKKWITNKFSRGRVHYIRSIHDCILTSYKTVQKDNPLLNCRIEGLKKNSPTRIILDKNFQIKLSSNILKTSKEYPTIIIINKEKKKKIAMLKSKKVKIIIMPLNKSGNFNLKNVLEKIKKLGFNRILIEAGLKLISSFLRENLIHDFQLFISNKNLNNKGSANFKNYMKLFLKNKKFIKEKVNLFGENLYSYKIK